MSEDTIDAGGEEAETAADAADEKGVEAVEARENLAGEFLGVVGLFAKEDGMDVGAFEEDDPVTGQERVEDGDKINRGGAAGRLALGPDADGVNLAGNFEVTVLLVLEVFDALEGGDKFAASGVAGEVLDGMAGGEHGFMIEEVGHVRNGEHDNG